MREIVVLIPDIEPDQNIEIDVKISGVKHNITYRVELIRLDQKILQETNRVSLLKHKISDYDKDWELVEIGSPSNNDIPIIFRKKSSQARLNENDLLNTKSEES